MVKRDVKLGTEYLATVNNRRVKVMLTSVCSFGGWHALNMATGKTVRIRTAARLKPVPPPRQIEDPAKQARLEAKAHDKGDDDYAEIDGVRYPRWVYRYDYEDFDRAQTLAQKLTDQDRAAGKPGVPAYGYSGERFDQAQRLVRAAIRGL